MVFGETELTIPNDVNTQYRPAPTVTRIVAFGTSERGVLVSSAIGATMSNAAIASTANSSALRKPVHPAVAADGLNGCHDRWPLTPCLIRMYRHSSATKPASIVMNSPTMRAEMRMSFLVM